MVFTSISESISMWRIKNNFIDIHVVLFKHVPIPCIFILCRMSCHKCYLILHHCQRHLNVSMMILSYLVIVWEWYGSLKAMLLLWFLLFADEDEDGDFITVYNDDELLALLTYVSFELWICMLAPWISFCE